MFAAFLASVALATIVFGTMLVLLGSWVQDIDSKRKVYRLSLYMMIVSSMKNLSILLFLDQLVTFATITFSLCLKSNKNSFYAFTPQNQNQKEVVQGNISDVSE